MTSWLERSSPDQGVLGSTLCLGTTLCILGQDTLITLTGPLTTQVYKWLSANIMLGVTLLWTSIPSRGE